MRGDNKKSHGYTKHSSTEKRHQLLVIDFKLKREKEFTAKLPKELKCGN